MTIADHYHRPALALVSAGVAPDERAALDLLGSLSLHLRIDPALTSSLLAKTAAEAIARCAPRAFLGGLTFEGPDLGLTGLGAKAQVADVITIGIGDVPADLHLYVDGMRCGVVLSDDVHCFAGWGPAAIGAASLAMAHAWEHATWKAGFTFRSGARMGDPRSRRDGVDLLQPGTPWYNAAPQITPSLIPLEAFVLGLGHLGQGFLFAFETLPFSDRSGVSLILQDYDYCTPANLSTSVLSERRTIGVMKTRICAEWLENRGISTRIVERALTKGSGRITGDPPVLVAGVDKLEVRRLFDNTGFPLTIDAGLGATATDMTYFQLTTLPAEKPAEVIFSEPTMPLQNAYEQSEEFARLAPMDPCGASTIAGTSVGIPFVGTFVGALTVGRLVAHVNGLSSSSIIAGDVCNLTAICTSDAIPNDTVVLTQSIQSGLR